MIACYFSKTLSRWINPNPLQTLYSVVCPRRLFREYKTAVCGTVQCNDGDQDAGKISFIKKI